MNNQVLISIIIVCYNYAHLLPRALEAIAKQKFRDFEIVFVDNGCTDNSLGVMQTFSKDHPNIPVTYVIIEKNIGLAYGDNKGVEAAKGKYLMFHDADDWMDDNALQMLADTAISANADRVIPAFRDVDMKGNTLQVQELGEIPNHWLYGLVQGNLFRSDLYKSLGIYTETLSPDIEKTFWFSSACERAAYVFTPCYNMLVHGDSTSRENSIYKRLLTDDSISTIHLISLCMKRMPDKENKDYQIAVYELTRVYYGHIFRFLRYAPLYDTIKIYDSLHRQMKGLLPDYMACTREALKNKKATRPYGRRVALLAYTLEKNHLMHCGLALYHYISKIIYLRE